jgi:hypothetical protein
MEAVPRHAEIANPLARKIRFDRVIQHLAELDVKFL